MELRFYTFVNYYLSPIQQGVQTGHAAVDLVRKYCGNGPIDLTIKQYQVDLVEEWADNHKTFIILNGGNNASLNATLSLVEAMNFPYISFCEDERSLGGIMTTVGVLLPDSVFAAQMTDEGYYQSELMRVDDLTGEESIESEAFFQGDPVFDFLNVLRGSRLA